MSGAIETPQVLLAHHLKLPTFLREYAKVAAECAKEGADHPKFLLRLAELELLDLARCDYINAHDNIIALGNSGTGRTHVALAHGLPASSS